MKTLTAENTVLVPVPAEIVQDIIRIRDAIMRGEVDAARVLEPVGGNEEPMFVEVPYGGKDQGAHKWTKQMVRELRDRMKYPLVKVLMDTCATSPGTWIPKGPIDDLTPKGPAQLRNELGALSRLTKSLFGRATWPFEYRVGPFCYQMDQQVARWWLEP